VVSEGQSLLSSAKPRIGRADRDRRQELARDSARIAGRSRVIAEGCLSWALNYWSDPAVCFAKHPARSLPEGCEGAAPVAERARLACIIAPFLANRAGARAASRSTPGALVPEGESVGGSRCLHCLPWRARPGRERSFGFAKDKSARPKGLKGQSEEILRRWKNTNGSHVPAHGAGRMTDGCRRQPVPN